MCLVLVYDDSYLRSVHYQMHYDMCTSADLVRTKNYGQVDKSRKQFVEQPWNTLI